MNINKIPTNQQTDFLMGRNGPSKLQAIEVWDSQGMVYIDGINSKGVAVSNGGFRFAADPVVLRQLANSFATLANEADQRLSRVA